MKKIFQRMIFMLMVGVFLAVPAPLLAISHTTGPNLNQVLPDKPTNVPREFADVRTAIGTIFNVIIVIAGTIFVILFLIGGVMYLTGAGNEEQTGKAKKLMVDAIIGLVLTLAAWAIGTFLLGKLGFTGSAIPVGIISGGGGGSGGGSGGSAVDYSILGSDAGNADFTVATQNGWSNANDAMSNPNSAYNQYIKSYSPTTIQLNEYNMAYRQIWQQRQGG